MRDRLTNRGYRPKTAELTDPNQLGREKRVNPPADKYETWKETKNHDLPDLDTQWKKDKRNEVGLPAPITAAQKAEALKNARAERERTRAELSKKAEACLKIAQILLPGVEEKIAEDQAVELMDLPTSSVVNLLRRKYEMLEREAANSEIKPEVTDAKCAEDKAEDKPALKPGEKCPKCHKNPCECKPEVKSSEIKPEVKEEEITISASDEDAILDQIFAADTPKKEGAKKLGTVKKASAGDVKLENLWKSDPDVSDAFGM